MKYKIGKVFIIAENIIPQCPFSFFNIDTEFYNSNYSNNNNNNNNNNSNK